MKTMKVLVDGHRQGVIAVHHIELAYVVHEADQWKLKMCLASGRDVTSFSFDSRMQAETALAHLFSEG